MTQREMERGGNGRKTRKQRSKWRQSCLLSHEELVEIYASIHRKWWRRNIFYQSWFMGVVKSKGEIDNF